MIKEPWQMTREEYVKPPYTSPAMHKYGVKQALSEGKPVPAEVLKDYPDLAAKKANPKIDQADELNRQLIAFEKGSSATKRETKASLRGFVDAIELQLDNLRREQNLTGKAGK